MASSPAPGITDLRGERLFAAWYMGSAGRCVTGKAMRSQEKGLYDANDLDVAPLA